MRKQLDAATAATQNGVRLFLNMGQRFRIATIIGKQTNDTLKRLLERDIAEDDVDALYSVRHKLKIAPSNLAQYQKGFGGDIRIDIDRMDESDTEQFPLDSMEARLLGSLLRQWLKKEAAIIERDWAACVIEKLPPTSR